MITKPNIGADSKHERTMANGSERTSKRPPEPKVVGSSSPGDPTRPRGFLLEVRSRALASRSPVLGTDEEKRLDRL